MISTGYIQAGAKVYIASRDEKSLIIAAKELTALGPGVCHYIVADLATVQGVDHIVAELTRREKRKSRSTKLSTNLY